MLEPQGTLFFLLLMVAFGALVVWLVLTKQVVFRVLAACLAFIPAMVFGIAAVNKYYDYYQTWGALFSDLSGQAQSIPHLSAASLKRDGSLQQQISSTNAGLDAQFGDLFSTTVTGPRSHITRQVYVYLPPQYFAKAYANYRFPAIELLHGAPGQPATWVNVMNVIPIYLNLLAEHKASPAVLVMPDTDGGLQYSLQCLNDPHGLQDMTFVGKEVPNWAAANLRVQRPGLMWGIAGYSEGGFCAANIGLQDATRFGYVGVESGYFAPDASQVPTGGKAGGKPHDINVFAHDKRLLEINTPDEYIQNIPVGTGPGVLPRGGRRRPVRRAERGVLQAAAPAAGRRRAACGHRERRGTPGQGLAVGADPDARVDDRRAVLAGPALCGGRGRQAAHGTPRAVRSQGERSGAQDGSHAGPARDGLISPGRRAWPSAGGMA